MIPRRARTRLQPVAATVALAAVAAALLATPDPVGAVFTAEAAVGGQSIGTAVVADLAAAAVTRSADGAATVSWSTPEGDVQYTVERTVAGVTETITPITASADGVTSFTDALVAPTAGSCATGWVHASRVRCVPAGTVSYRVLHTLAGWSPENSATVSVAPLPSPTVTTTPGHVADVFGLRVHITNTTADTKTYTVRFPLWVNRGGLVNVLPSFTNGVDAEGQYATWTVGAGQTFTGELRWRGAAAGDVITVTTSDGVAPRTVTTVVVP